MRRLIAVAVGIFSILVLSISWAEMGKGAMPLKAASGSKAEGHLTEGIEHFEKGHWDVAKKHFTEGAKADPQSGEAHY
jgi:uncharacterized protein HemY